MYVATRMRVDICNTLRTESVGNGGDHLLLRIYVDSNPVYQALNDLSLDDLIVTLLEVGEASLELLQQALGVSQMRLGRLGQGLLSVQGGTLLAQGHLFLGDSVQAGFGILQG